jgi:K(+)-stimulated pyrophosphate-energized sodium pump
MTRNVMNALYKGFCRFSYCFNSIFYTPVTDHVLGFTTEYNVNGKNFNGMSLYYCGIIGLVITGLLIWITEILYRHKL